MMRGQWDAYTSLIATEPYAQTRVGGPAPVAIMDAARPAGDFSDPPVPKLLNTEVGTELARRSIDLGGGRLEAKNPRDSFLVIPPGIAAKAVIFERQAKVTDVARELGFRSSAHFSTASRKHYGTPTGYRGQIVDCSIEQDL
jgi:hypothetical protein